MSVFFHHMADMLVSNNIQWSIGKKHFRRRYGTTQATNHPSLAYYNTDNNIFSICEPCTGSFVCHPIATAKVLFPNWLLYVVGHQHVDCAMEEYGCAHPVKTLHSQNFTNHKASPQSEEQAANSDACNVNLYTCVTLTFTPQCAAFIVYGQRTKFSHQCQSLSG